MAATADPVLLPAILRGDMDGAAYPILPPRNADSAGGLLSVERDLSGDRRRGAEGDVGRSAR